MSSAMGGCAIAAPREFRRLSKALFLSSSLVSATALFWAGQARTETTISNSRNTPVATSTAASGAPDDVTVSGSIRVTSGAAVTLDSDNTVSNTGTVKIQDANDVTGVLAVGGHTGSITNSGSITVNETTTFKDGAGNTVTNGPFANGADRFAIRLLPGTDSLTGTVNNSGSISLQGANSAAISLEAPLVGSVLNSGTIAANGPNTFAIRTTGPVSGDVTLDGTITATGQSTQGVALGGDVGGGVAVEGAVTATGYVGTVRSTDPSVLAKLGADDLLQGGTTLTVGGSVARGLLVAAPPATLDSSNTDLNGDGLPDSTETRGAVTSFGSAPAIVVGAAGRSIALGDVGTGQSAYGVVIGGAVAGSGVYDGFSATGLQLGVDGGQVSTGRGMTVVGSVTASAYVADATAIHITNGATAPTIYNAGTITGTSIGDGHAARGIVADAGASVPILLNAGVIAGRVSGASGNAVAIRDASGTLSHLENTGTIEAAITPTTTTTTTTTTGGSGQRIAIDVTANTTGFDLVSYGSASPTITGSILMGSGSDRLDLLAGTVTGDLRFGAGANVLDIDGGANVIGAVTAEGGGLALSIGSGSLQINSTDHLQMTGLTLGAASSLRLTVDPEAGAATLLDVAGSASVAGGAKIGVRMTSLLKGAATYTLIHADSLNLGAVDTSLIGAIPYLYTGSFVTDPAAGSLSVALARKSAAELQLPAATAAAYEPIIANLDADPALRDAVLAQTGRSGLMSAYNQLLPNRTGVFEVVSAGLEAFGRPLDDRQSTDGRGAWAEEVNFGLARNDQAGLPGYRSWAVGLEGGYEFPATRVGVFGTTFGGFSSELRNHDEPSGGQLIANVLEAGGYWRVTRGGLSVNARVAADWLSASNHRAVSITDPEGGSSLYAATATGRWSGLGLTSRLHLSYEAHLDSLYIRPQLGLDYVELKEDGYREGGGGAGLDLQVDARNSSELSGFAGVAIGAVFGNDAGNWGPELLLGYRDAIQQKLGDTTARFAGGDPFTLTAEDGGSGGAVLRLGLKSESAWGAVAIEGGGEVRGDLTIYDLKLAAHFLF